ncbi:hypothetical protein LWI29_001610 [Acer saccharum]|uniref:Uncharacterized protein n=1 Tax=Acer saccharum TaxID=4024 RepID=A0AA39RKX0_ACESA|nr:hypothetical protein LWI29_001610 [Acer saccharum]
MERRLLVTVWELVKSWQGSPRNSVDSGKTRVTGKVKEFVKIFNQEAFSKPKRNVDSKSQSSRWKEMETSKPEKEAKFSKIGTDKKTHMPNKHDNKSLSDASVAVDEHLQRSEKQHILSNVTPQKKDSSITASVPNDSKAVAGDVDETFQVNFQVKELGPVENKMTRAGNDPEEIQDIDAKIRKWLNGKEGNIRSLLSTLQYVLWTGSGWKPVPLVDIIEANAVKRSYQKALLCYIQISYSRKGQFLIKSTLQKKFSIFCRIHGLISTLLVHTDYGKKKRKEKKSLCQSASSVNNSTTAQRISGQWVVKIEKKGGVDLKYATSTGDPLTLLYQNSEQKRLETGID